MYIPIFCKILKRQVKNHVILPFDYTRIYLLTGIDRCYKLNCYERKGSCSDVKLNKSQEQKCSSVFPFVLELLFFAVNNDKSKHKIN